MTKIAIQPNAAGTGTFTIEAPNSNSNRTLVLPDAAGELDTLQRAGNVLQVVMGTTTTQATSTSTTWAASNLSASITPTSATSKIAVYVSGGMNGFAGGGAADEKMGMKIYRQIGSGSFAELENSSSGQQVIYGANGNYSGLSINYLDSPATASQVNYALYFRREQGTSTASINRDSNNQTQMILMEIAG